MYVVSIVLYNDGFEFPPFFFFFRYLFISVSNEMLDQTNACVSKYSEASIMHSMCKRQWFSYATKCVQTLIIVGVSVDLTYQGVHWMCCTVHALLILHTSFITFLYLLAI